MKKKFLLDISKNSLGLYTEKLLIKDRNIINYIIEAMQELMSDDYPILLPKMSLHYFLPGFLDKVFNKELCGYYLKNTGKLLG